ncbi:ASCH domain-containing protein [Pseudomonas promysalinigenes]|uniref:ASCH domain-containing protein n=1 Tax=Pseudomonas promysalinigenes TaxID=485898 RepID=UPI003F9EBBF8
MKALSIVQPSGTRIAAGVKTLEVRRWHPGLNPTEDLLIVENGRFLHADADEDHDGIAVAIVRIRAVRPFVLADMAAACASYFEAGWLAWELTDVRPIRPFSARAARGIYEVEVSTEACETP